MAGGGKEDAGDSRKEKQGQYGWIEGGVGLENYVSHKLRRSKGRPEGKGGSARRPKRLSFLG